MVSHRWKFTPVEPQMGDLCAGTPARFIRTQHLLPGAVFRVAEQVTSALELCVHLQHDLVPFRAHVDKIFVEGKLESVDAVSVRLDAGPCQLVTGLDWRHLLRRKGVIFGVIIFSVIRSNNAGVNCAI